MVFAAVTLKVDLFVFMEPNYEIYKCREDKPMIKKSKQNLLLDLLLGTFFLYFLSIILSNNLWGNILSPLVAFLSSLLIFISAKQFKKYKLYAILTFFSTLFWGIADFLWLIYDNVLFISPENIPFINALYVLPNICFAILLTHYIFKSFRKWSLYQIIIDIFTIAVTGMLLLWTLILSRTTLPFRLDFDYILILIYIFLDFCILTEIGLVYLSKGFKNIPKSMFLALLGIVIYAWADYYYAYLSLLTAYEPNTIIDVVYMLCNVLFAISAIYETAHPSRIEPVVQNKLSENLRKPKKTVFLLVLIFHFLYVIDIFSLHALVIFTAVCVLYWISTTSLRSNMLDKRLLQTEKEMNQTLEMLVDERTKELNYANQHLEELSNRDTLTGLYNRRCLMKKLDSLLTSNSNKPFALLYIDANRFKFINDFYGHETGDKVLIALGARVLKNCTPSCTAFRVAGDEFAVIIENNIDKSYIGAVTEKILEIIRTPISVPPYIFTLSASIGISLYPADAKDRDTLMRYADISMYEIKANNHKNGYLFFDKMLTEKINKKQEIEFLLQNADYDKEFILYFQPQYSTKTKSLIGMEALIRWIQPQKGLIPPSEFIPIAEETGMILNIGEWVVDRAFLQIKKWNQENNLNLKMSINISPMQIENAGFVDYLREKLQYSNIEPSWIDLEITESCTVNSSVSIEQIFDLLDEIGVSTSIDDFGTGYSSLSYIKKFNIDRLKIAKELIDNIDCDEGALLIVQAIIMMAKGLKLKIIAEGVEDINQLKILEELGCDEIQGYIFGKPVPSDEFENQHIKIKVLKCSI